MARSQRVVLLPEIILFTITSIFLLVASYLFSMHPLSRHETVQIPDVKVLPPEVKEKLREHPTANTFHIPILMYHYIEYVADKKDTIRQSLALTPAVFALQIQTLQKAGYTFLTMRDVGDIMAGSLAVPDKPIVLTFDDGYKDFFTDAYPVLKKFGVKATAYIIPGFLGGNNYMTEGQVQELAKNPDIEIAAHTVHHVWLKHQPYANAREEIFDSKTQLEAMIHLPVVSFAYPYGAFDDQAVALVKDAGFVTGVSTIPGIEEHEANRYYIFRLRPGARTGQTLITYLEQTVFKPY